MARCLNLANGTKAKIRNIMSAIYSHDKRQGWTEFNPIGAVRQSAKREHLPDVLTPSRLVLLLKDWNSP